MSKIKFQFDPDQEYQLAAVRSVIDLFEGHTPYRAGFLGSEEIIPNIPPDEMLYDSDLRANLEYVQNANGLPVTGELEKESGMVLEGIGVDSHDFPQFTIEMETGTGKTYVYLRTIYELNKNYGFTKFIIVVPSIAIYEGVFKTDLITRSHFASLYDNNTLNLIPYDGSRPGQVRSFANSSQIQVLLMTIDAFNKKSNNFYKATDKLQGSGLRPFEFVAATRPIVILDEPQSVDSTEKAKSAIRTLKPLFSLRYSATHRRSPNLIYRLSPVDAYHQGLVKKIEVTGIDALDNLNDMQLALEDVLMSPFRAKIRTLVNRSGTSSSETVTLKQGEDLYRHTKREEHREGFKVEEISVTGEKPFVTFENQVKLELGSTTAPLRSEIFRAQIRETIIEHLQRQEKLHDLGIKVLSLFFIDRVSNYTDDDGIIRKLFDEEFDHLKPAYKHFSKLAPEDVRSSYFAKKKSATGEFAIDTSAKTAEEREAEKAAFSLIMRDKEKLLSFDEKVSFIFAHSALKEGWDNPNVFQICTLNQTISEVKKRQEIGRGLRLCVDQTGQRIFDEDVNVLTVVANDSYKDYVESLQNEYIADGETEAPPKPSSSRKSTAFRRDPIFLGADFREFWEKLEQKADYIIKLQTASVVNDCIQRLSSYRFPEPKIVISKGEFIMASYRISLDRVSGNVAHLRIASKASDGSETVRSIPVEVGSKLDKVCKDDTLREFKVMAITSDSEARVVFENDLELNQYNEIPLDVQISRKPVVSTVEFKSNTASTFDFISRIADETQLTRKTMVEIFCGLPPTTQEQVIKNPEGFTNKFVEVVKDVVGRTVAESIEYRIVPDQSTDLEELFPVTKSYPQRELIPAGERGLYDQMQVDSEVERNFINRNLVEQSDVVFYFKFPPKFKINLPKIINNYNPDWGIVRQPQGSVQNFEIVVETKGGLDIAKLRFASEGWKIRCAIRFFAELGITYRHVDGNTFTWAVFDGQSNLP